MSAQMKWDPAKGTVTTTASSNITAPWVAIGWLLFMVLLLISPALVWAGWKLLL